jgi:hypothetical protein
MIFEVLSTTKDTNGCDIGAIVHYIEVRWRSLLIFNPCISWKIFCPERGNQIRMFLAWLKNHPVYN